jgi:hypothetical protein
LFSGAINFCNSMDLGNVSSGQLCGHDSRGHRAALSRGTFSFSRISPRLRFFVHRIAALAMVCLRYISTFRSYMRGNGLSRLHAATNRESTRPGRRDTDFIALLYVDTPDKGLGVHRNGTDRFRCGSAAGYIGQSIRDSRFLHARPLDHGYWIIRILVDTNRGILYAASNIRGWNRYSLLHSERSIYACIALDADSDSALEKITILGLGRKQLFFTTKLRSSDLIVSQDSHFGRRLSAANNMDLVDRWFATQASVRTALRNSFGNGTSAVG